jgi:hypothetical protein
MGKMALSDIIYFPYFNYDFQKDKFCCGYFVAYIRGTTIKLVYYDVASCENNEEEIFRNIFDSYVRPFLKEIFLVGNTKSKVTQVNQASFNVVQVKSDSFGEYLKSKPKEIKGKYLLIALCVTLCSQQSVDDSSFPWRVYQDNEIEKCFNNLKSVIFYIIMNSQLVNDSCTIEIDEILNLLEK